MRDIFCLLQRWTFFASFALLTVSFAVANNDGSLYTIETRMGMSRASRNECTEATMDVFETAKEIPSECAIDNPLCVCRDGYYTHNSNVDAQVEDGDVCIPCPPNAICPRGWVNGDETHVGATIETLQRNSSALPLRGYMQDSDSEFRECVMPHHCTGYLYKGVCAAGYTGRLCSACQGPDYVPIGFECLEKTDSISAWMAFAIIITIAYITMPLYPKILSVLNSISILKILHGIKFIQIYSFFRYIRTDWTNFLSRWMRVMSFGAFSWGELIVPGYANSYESTILSSITVEIVIPYVFLFISGSMIAITTMKKGLQSQSRASNYAVAPSSSAAPNRGPPRLDSIAQIQQNIVALAILCSKLCYINVAAATIRYFSCTPGPGGISYLRHHPDVRCDTDEWVSHVFVGILGIIHTIAEPIISHYFAKMAFDNSGANHDSVFAGYIKLLRMNYARHGLMFDTFESLSKLVFVLLLMVVKDEQNQVEICLVALFAVCIFGTWKTTPYQEAEDAIIEISGHSVSVLWLLVSVIYHRNQLWNDERGAIEISLSIVTFFWHFYIFHRVVFSDHSFFGFRPEKKSMYASHKLGLKVCSFNQ
eukprot:TRINITY_DN6219_c0_g1_i4.p1 TRINITY_DN6219_c0_g1~~TRINITY_DN6219_c0_g1_i4.p1  ORF type:complete len:594 (+),score=87.64 TRINITY_DN6219_c0_g1_i4:74-1855(+)